MVAGYVDNLARGYSAEPGAELIVQPVGLEQRMMVFDRTKVAGQKQQIARRNVGQDAVQVTDGDEVHELAFQGNAIAD